jgi:hypothetical protein
MSESDVSSSGFFVFYLFFLQKSEKMTIKIPTFFEIISFQNESNFDFEQKFHIFRKKFKDLNYEKILLKLNGDVGYWQYKCSGQQIKRFTIG